MGMNKKVVMVFATTALLGIAAVGSTLAFFTDSGEATNVISMGKVGIALDEPTFSENDYSIKDVLPGDVIEKDPLITVDGDSADVYIRAIVEFENLTSVQGEQLEQGIQFVDGWIKGNDGYYYYTAKSLSANEEVYLFTAVSIPQEWGNEIAKQEFKIKITAQAIQAENFTPTYEQSTGDFGWFYSDGVTPVEPESYVEESTEIN